MSRLTFFEFLSEWEGFKTEFAQLKEKIALLETKTVTEEEKSLKVSEHTEYPVPPDYREIVNSILNSHFGIEYEPRIDIPSFQFSILVPPKYSPSKGTNEDRRMNVISNAEGQFGVKAYTEKVWNTFSQDVQAQIIAEKE